jgi:hypothetical protein
MLKRSRRSPRARSPAQAAIYREGSQHPSYLITTYHLCVLCDLCGNLSHGDRPIMQNKPNGKMGNLKQPDPLATNRSPAVAKAIFFSQIYVPTCPLGIRHQNKPNFKIGNLAQPNQLHALVPMW